MENEQKKQKDQDESTLSAGELFVKELKEMPYTNDRVGQAFVIIPFKKPPAPRETGNDQNK